MILDFGKHKGKPVEWIFKNDYKYFQWILNNDRLKQQTLKQFCINYLDRYMKVIEEDKQEYNRQSSDYEDLRLIYNKKKPNESLQIMDFEL